MSVTRWRPSRVAIVLGVCWLAVLVVWWRAPVLAMLLGLIVGVLSSLAFVYVMWRVVCPVVDLAAQADQIAVGGDDTLDSPCGGIAEVEVLRRSLNAMAGHVRRAQTMGHAHAAAISTAQETERARLAHELHDATVQSLIAVAQRLDRAGRAIDATPERARTLVGDARQEVVTTVAGLRDIIADLRPPALDELGLVPALELFIQRLPASPKVHLHLEGVVRRLDPDRELAALRMVQEALSNVRRHALATRADVHLAFDADALHIVVEDDGQGFLPEDMQGGDHWGLVGLHERAARYGGEVALDSRPGQGTRLAIRLPDRAVVQPTTETIDPVCHARIQPDAAFGSAVYDGTEYFFCCPVCQGAFQRDPARYTA